MANFTFDIVSQLDRAELNNVYDQTKRDIASRYDFKDSLAAIEWLSDDKNGFKLTASNDYQIDAILDVIRKKLATRNLSQHLIDESGERVTSNLKVTLEVPFKQGLDQSKTKELSKLIREELPKLKSVIQGDTLRVSGPSKDDLQAAMALVRQQSLDYPVQFINFR
jgi:uncharacterized protein YajQ (UPF0234 family)